MRKRLLTKKYLRDVKEYIIKITKDNDDKNITTISVITTIDGLNNKKWKVYYTNIKLLHFVEKFIMSVE